MKLPGVTAYGVDLLWLFTVIEVLPAGREPGGLLPSAQHSLVNYQLKHVRGT